MGILAIISHYRWGNWGAERLSESPKITQQRRVRQGTWGDFKLVSGKEWSNLFMAQRKVRFHYLLCEPQHLKVDFCVHFPPLKYCRKMVMLEAFSAPTAFPQVKRKGSEQEGGRWNVSVKGRGAAGSLNLFSHRVTDIVMTWDVQLPSHCKCSWFIPNR